MACTHRKSLIITTNFYRAIGAAYLIYKNYQIQYLIVLGYSLLRTVQKPKEKPMSLINTSIQPFNTTAYHDGKFVPVSDANLNGQWSVVFFYPADSPSFVQQNWAT